MQEKILCFCLFYLFYLIFVFLVFYYSFSIKIISCILKYDKSLILNKLFREIFNFLKIKSIILVKLNLADLSTE